VGLKSCPLAWQTSLELYHIGSLHPPEIVRFSPGVEFTLFCRGVSIPRTCWKCFLNQRHSQHTFLCSDLQSCKFYDINLVIEVHNSTVKYRLPYGWSAYLLRVCLLTKPNPTQAKKCFLTIVIMLQIIIVTSFINIFRKSFTFLTASVFVIFVGYNIIVLYNCYLFNQWFMNSVPYTVHMISQ